MATVDIEPASLAVTPGESHTLMLTLRNDGDDIEAYHLTVVDDAAGDVVIEPDTLLVHPGETVTAAATLRLEHTGRSRSGDLIVRFHIVPAGRPDDFLVAEAIATIESFSDVAAVLKSPALEGRRGAATDVTISNAGNAPTNAEVSVSAGELALFVDRSHPALPADSAESVELSVRARSLQWRGEPAQHPFVVTVTPEGGQSISLNGTFTQLPIFARWALTTAIAAGAVAVAAVLVWVGAVVIGGAVGTPAASTASATAPATETAAPSEAPPPEPDVRTIVASTADDDVRAGDPVVFRIEPAVEGAPDDSLVAMEVEWPEGLTLADQECEAWVDPDTDRVLEGRPRSGDECVIELSGGRDEAALTFTTPPVGFSGAVSARATRLVALDDDEATTVETGPDSDFGAEAEAEIDLIPYEFWMELRDIEPSDEGPDAAVIIHRVMRGDGSEEEATMAFEIAPPGFIDGIRDTDQCDDRDGTTCYVNFGSPDDGQTNDQRVIDLYFDPNDARGIGTLSVTGASLTDVAPNQVDRSVRGAEELLVSDRMFDIDVILNSDEDIGQGATVTAIINVIAGELPTGITTYVNGTMTLGLELGWPGGLIPVDAPVGCTLDDNVCTLPSPSPGEPATITWRFVVDDPFDDGEISARGVTLTYDPTTAADGRDGRTQPTESLWPHWIGSDAESFQP